MRFATTTTSYLRSILCLGAALTAIGLMAIARADASTITLDATGGGSVIDESGDNVGDTTIASAHAGDDQGDVERSIAIFTLPTLSAGQTIDSATFRIRLFNIEGTPGDGSLYHLPGSNGSTVTTGMFGPPAAFVANSTGFVTASSATPAYYDVDVTSQVLTDYASDPSNDEVSTFRIQIDTGEGSVAENGKDRYVFYSPSGGSPPELVLNVVPEPGSLALMGLGTGLMVLRRRR